MGIIRELAASGPVVMGDEGYLGEDCIRTPYLGRSKLAFQKDTDRARARLRTPASTPMPSSGRVSHLAQAPLPPLAPRAAGHWRPAS